MKNGVFLAYFPSNPQDKFYEGDKFKKVLSYLQKYPKDAQLKEKISKDGQQLMMRKEHIQCIDEVINIMEKILE